MHVRDRAPAFAWWNQGKLHGEVEIKPQLKLRGSVAKEDDPKPSHKL